MTKMIKQDLQRLTASLGSRCSQLRRRVCECVVIGREFVKGDIVGANQSQLFQAGIGETPSPSLVGPNTMRQNAAQRSFRLNLADSPCLGIEHPLLPTLSVGSGESKRRLHAAPEFIVRQPLRPGSSHG